MSQENSNTYTKKNFGVGTHLGFGQGTNLGAFGDYYSPALSMSYGFDFLWKQSQLILDVTSNQHNSKSTYVGEKTFKGTCGIDVINFHYGYRVLNVEKLYVTPFIGYGRIEFTTYSDDNSKLIIPQGNLVFGCATGYAYRNKLKKALDVFIPINRYKQTFFQGKLFITRVNYYDDFEGYLLNFSLGIFWQVHRVELN